MNDLVIYKSYLSGMIVDLSFLKLFTFCGECGDCDDTDDGDDNDDDNDNTYT